MANRDDQRAWRPESAEAKAVVAFLGVLLELLAVGALLVAPPTDFYGAFFELFLMGAIGFGTYVAVTRGIEWR